MAPRTFHVGVKGFGPRGAELAKMAIITFLAEEKNIQSLREHGNFFKIKIDFFEKKSFEGRAVGGAFPLDCHGLINTSVVGPKDYKISNLDKIAPEHADLVKWATDLPSLINNHVQANCDAIMEEYKRTSAVAAANLEFATNEDGTINTGISCVQRSTYGKVLQKQLDRVLSEGTKLVKDFVTFDVHYETEVVSEDVAADILKPSYKTKDLRTGETTTRNFDLVISAEGTTRKSFLPDDLAERTETGEPNYDNYRARCEALDLLDADGLLRKDAKILLGGTGAGFGDAVGVAARLAGLTQLDVNEPSCLGFIPQKLEQYQGAFGYFSRHEGNVLPPRLKYDARFPGTMPLTDEIIEAAMISRDADEVPKLMKIMKAAIANVLGTPYDEIYPDDITTLERQRGYLKSIDDYFAAPDGKKASMNEAALMRVAAMVVGDGASPFEDGSRQAAFQAEYPPFRAGRNGWPHMLALAAGHSDPEALKVKSNAPFWKVWQYEIHPHFTAGPIPLSQLAEKLHDCGVLEHHAASYSDLKRDPDTGKILCGGKLYDLVIRSPQISIEGSSTHSSLNGKVRESIPGQPVFAKSRLYQTPQGQVCHAMEHGVAGHGTVRRNDAGEEELVSQAWENTNSHHAVADLMPSVVKYIFEAAALKANGYENFAIELTRRYDASLPSDKEYEEYLEAVKAARKDYDALVAYVDFCIAYAGRDLEKFQKAFKECMSNVGDRAKFVMEHSDCGDRNGIGAEYFNSIANPPPFTYPTKQEWFGRYIDLTPEEEHARWLGICNDIKSDALGL